VSEPLSEAIILDIIEELRQEKENDLLSKSTEVQAAAMEERPKVDTH